VGYDRVSPIAFVVALVGVACRPVDTLPPEEPGAAPIADVSFDDEADVEIETDVRAGDGGFSVTLASRCRDAWNGTVVRATSKEGFTIDGTREERLRMQPGDALLLTTPHGGIFAMDFDKVTVGYAARVEVTPECTVRRTWIPEGNL
jgi:hypothetical protein